MIGALACEETNRERQYVEGKNSTHDNVRRRGIRRFKADSRIRGTIFCLRESSGIAVEDKTVASTRFFIIHDSGDRFDAALQVVTEI